MTFTRVNLWDYNTYCMTKNKRNANRLIKRLIYLLVFIVILVVVGNLAGWIGKKKEIEVELAKASRTTIIEKVSASGTVQPVTEVKLAPEVSGEIRELLVEEGDSVQRGTLLVKIRPDTWVSQLQRAEASLNQQQANVVSSEASVARAEATFERVKLEYERQEKLWKEKVISDADWQIAQQNYRVAENDLKASRQSLQAAKYTVKSGEATVNEARENVRLTSVMAPMDGIISKLGVKKGERVVGTQTMAGTEMMRIADLNVMEVRVDVNENDIVRVHEGDTAIIDVDAYSNQEKKFKGIVTLIANTAKDKLSADAITEFEVRILILQDSYKDLVEQGNPYPFRPGMTASVEILTRRKANALSLPLAAVTTRNPDHQQSEEEGQDGDKAEDHEEPSRQNVRQQNKVVVFVNDHGTARMVEVKTGISDYDNIEISSGLTDSSEVVTGPFLVVSKRLKEGDKIIRLEKKDKEGKQ